MSHWSTAWGPCHLQRHQCSKQRMWGAPAFLCSPAPCWEEVPGRGRWLAGLPGLGRVGPTLAQAGQGPGIWPCRSVPSGSGPPSFQQHPLPFPPSVPANNAPGSLPWPHWTLLGCSGGALIPPSLPSFSICRPELLALTVNSASQPILPPPQGCHVNALPAQPNCGLLILPCSALSFCCCSFFCQSVNKHELSTIMYQEGRAQITEC